MFTLIVITTGCSLEKKTKFNQALQNLTAHYNILFNANVLLKQKQDSYATAFIDAYGNILSVYQDTIAHTTTPDKDLDAAIAKAYIIINEKEQSHYIGNAYLVLGKAHFLAGQYFDAVEYLSYVIRSFPQQGDLTEEASAWKVRALLYLNRTHEAKLALDTAFKSINPKKSITADVYAARLQYDINIQNYPDAEEAAKKAIYYCRNKNQRLRWTFILGQLQELNNKNSDAITSYTRIVKSNAPFEMAFNANLNRIRIEDMRNGIKVDRLSLILSLLKNENNKEFKDQIYYQAAELYLANKDINNALKYYKLSIRNSVKNQNQKGLSYLRIADIDFDNRADYVNAKKYYDSTLTNLSPNYPGYQTIQKKSNNLQVLVEKLQIIAREDTLQMLAKLDEKARAARVDALVNAEILQQQTIANNNIATNSAANSAAATLVGSPATSFYFYNSNAVSRGYSDFKRVWGNRKLEDNWRRSDRSNSNAPVGGAASSGIHAASDPDALPAGMRKSTTDVSAGAYRQSLLQNLPLTPALLAQSNARIYDAYLGIANFYRDILEDKKAAIKAYEFLLNKFPANADKAYVYYSLDRLYDGIDASQSNNYKNKLLKEYPETVFAKVIIDPDYSKKLNDNDSRINDAYGVVYGLYSAKQYARVVRSVDSLSKLYPGNKLSAQLAYLGIISMGHQEKLEAFRAGLQQIIADYPKDQLITPLARQHLAYINAHTADLSALNYAIANSDTSGTYFTPPIAYQKDAVYNRDRRFVPVNDKPVAKTIEQAPIKEKTVSKPTIYINFSKRDSTNYYFVINVSTGTTDLSPSRFGIGQFNRTNFSGNTISHQLKNAGPDNQLIYVGRFYSLATVKDYARAIIPLLPDIMKVPKDKYSFFIITKENLDKLAGKQALDSYVTYYQQTY